MQIITTQFDADQCVQQKVHPGVTFNRGMTEVWQVLTTPVLPPYTAQWSIVESGEVVFIPAVPYRTKNTAADIVAAAFLIGLRAEHDRPADPPLVYRIIYDKGIREVDQNGQRLYEFYLGLAFRIK